MKTTLPQIARLSRVALEPDDVLVLECPGFLSRAQEDLLTAQLKQIWPTHAVLVLGDDKKLRIGFTVPDPAPPAKRKKKRGCV